MGCDHSWIFSESGNHCGGWSEKSSGHCVYHHYFFVSGNVDDESTPYGQAHCLSDRVGSSICGGSAIAATAPVIDAKDEEVAQSISVIFLFNVLAALIFPYLGHAIGLGTEGFAVFAGTAVNDTSSVTAAASTAEGIYGVQGIFVSSRNGKAYQNSGDHSPLR